MDIAYIIYTGLTIAYIILLGLYFWRRAHKHEKKLKEFHTEAKVKLDTHKKELDNKANLRIQKALQLVGHLQKVAEKLENQTQEEYQSIINQAKKEKKQIIADAKRKADEIVATADHGLEEYRQKRHQEIEKHFVKLVMTVTEKVIGKVLTYEDHLQLIQQTVQEIEQQQNKK